MKKTLLLKTMFLLCVLIVGSSSAEAEEVTIASFNASSANAGTLNGWTLNGNPTYATSGGGYYQLVTSSMTIVSPSITWSNYTDITITISARKYNGPNATQGKISVSQGGDELASYSPSNTSIISSSALAISPSSGAITISCPGASSNKGCGVGTIVIKGTPASTDPTSGVAFANTTPSMDLKDASSFTQTATTADGYAGTAGASVTYEMTANTAGATINANTGEVIPTQAGNVTVTATAAAISGHFSESTASYTLTVTDTRTFTIACHIGNNTNNIERISGATLSLDDPTSILGMSFVGWSSSNDVTSPEWIDNSTTITGDMELYAIYQAIEGEYSYHLVETDQADWRGDYLIAYSKTVFANGKENGTAGIGASSTVVKPGSYLEGKVIDSVWGDQYYISLEAIDDADLSKGYVLKTQDGYYNYHTSNSGNGINGTSKNKSTAASYPIIINYVSSSEINITLDKGQVFRYNTNESYFRYYKSTSYSSQGKVYLYKRTTDVEPVYSLGLTINVSIPASGYGTLSSTHALDFANAIDASDGKTLTAYVIPSNNGAKLTLVEKAEAPANTGILMKGTANETYTIPVKASAESVGDNLLKAGPITVLEDNETIYLLKSGQFHLATAGTTSVGKAYLELPEALGARTLSFSFEGEATAINGIEEVAPVITKTRKALKNGRLVIETANGEFTIDGARMK